MVARLRAQPGDHRPRQVDAVDRDATARQRQGDASRADAQFQRPAGAGELRQDVGHRVHNRRLEHLRRRLVVAGRDTFPEVAVLIVHRRTVPQQIPAARARSRPRLWHGRSS